jgi:2-dehydropantoate 2-reductase
LWQPVLTIPQFANLIQSIGIIEELFMHLVIFGAGGVGGYFGGRLAQAGERVTFLARGEHLQAMLAKGLRVDSIKGDFSIDPVTATDDPSAVRDVDAVLFCVKTWQIPNAAKAIIPIIDSHTLVLPLENGVEASSQLAEILGREHIMGGLCRLVSRIASPGHIQHSGIEPYIAFGELDNRISPRAQELLQVFQHAGLSAVISENISVAIWLKFLFISAVSGIGAITRTPFGGFRSLEGTRQMLIDTLQECYSVALAQGVKLPADSPANTLAYIDSLPPEITASMQRDIIEGRPSELESQNGAIVRMGQLYHVPTPVNSFIYYSLLPQETLARRSSA